MASLVVPLLIVLIINFLPENVLPHLGVHKEIVDSRETLKVPVSLGIVYLIISLAPFITFLVLDMRRINRGRKNKRSDNLFVPPDWDLED